MAAKKKHNKTIAVVPINNGLQIIKTPGNNYVDISTNVPCIDKDSRHIYVKGVIKIENVKERYEFNKEHRRPFRKPDKSVWTISGPDELNIFKQSLEGGAFRKWQGDKRMGWGVYVPQPIIDKTPQILGDGYLNEHVKVCEFREGNLHKWHGFPFNYMLLDEEYICDNALHLWERLGIIDKSEIEDIQNKEESILS